MPEEVIKAFLHGAKFECKEIEVEGVKKKFLKGARCYLYPSGMNIYRKSKGIKFPEENEMSYREVKKIVGSATPNYSRTLTISDDSEKVLNVITYQNYNMKRNNGK